MNLDLISTCQPLVENWKGATRRWHSSLIFVAALGVIALPACSPAGRELSVHSTASGSLPNQGQADVGNLVLPGEVDIQVAETFVRLGYALDKKQRFQSTEFLTPLLRTKQAMHLIQLVKSYNEFDGEKVAQALAAFEGRVSGVEFGRESSPVVYLALPYWSHQREVAPSGRGVRISEQENQELIDELRSAFVDKLGADEFSVQGRRVRVWWD